VNFIKLRRKPVINEEISGDNALLETSSAIRGQEEIKGYANPL